MVLEQRNCVESPVDYVCGMELVRANFSHIYSGTCLFTVLNINVFYWFVRLLARLIRVPLCFVISQV